MFSTNEPEQKILLLITCAHSDSFIYKPAQMHSLAREVAAHTHTK